MKAGRRPIVIVAERGDEDEVVLVHGGAVLEAARELGHETVRAIVLPRGSLVDELLSRITDLEDRVAECEELLGASEPEAPASP